MSDDLDLNLSVENYDFDVEEARKILRASYGDPNLTPRWERIFEEVHFPDLVADLQGVSRVAPMISCPFHGRDHKPSFKIYRGSNDGYCFGCPEGEKYYDSVRFVKAKFGYTNLQAIAWIEREYNLPPLEAVAEDEEDDDCPVVTVTLDFTHLSTPYIDLAARTLRQERDPEMARDYLSIYFNSKPRVREDVRSVEVIERCLPMAQVLGSTELERIKKEKLR